MEGARERQPGSLKYDRVGESTGRVNPDLGLKMEDKAGTVMWAESADMKIEL